MRTGVVCNGFFIWLRHDGYRVRGCSPNNEAHADVRKRNLVMAMLQRFTEITQLDIKIRKQLKIRR